MPGRALQELLLLGPMRPHREVVHMMHGPNSIREKVGCTLLAPSWQFVLSSWHCWTTFLRWCVLFRYYAEYWKGRKGDSFIHDWSIVVALGIFLFCVFSLLVAFGRDSRYFLAAGPQR